MGMIKLFLGSFIFWAAWIVIPVLMEIIPALGSFFLLLKRRKKVKNHVKPAIYPEISIMIPVYNSAATLMQCIESVEKSSYPDSQIRLFLVDNYGKDMSFKVFAECQERFPQLKMQWLSSEQGKSRALNLALYNSEGKYIINLDSDGVLDPNALTNLVDKFEANPQLNCLTGAILILPEWIQSYPKRISRLFRKLEFMEYAQAFLAGRSYASETDTVYTMSGAFSAFRKSAILKSWMYNSDTVGEDTHLTFQMRVKQGERIEVCENALFFVDPIESVNKLYTQRQRWQRGSLEVAKMFMGSDFKLRNFFNNVSVRTLLYDHTFAFPRMIWYLAMICLMSMSYSTKTIFISTVIIFALYVLIGFFYFSVVQYFLKVNPEVRSYYLRQWYCIFLMPFFNLGVFFFRMAGIINSISTESSWKAGTISEEWQALKKSVREMLSGPEKAYHALYKFFNAPEENESAAFSAVTKGQRR